jgi:anti-sigma factor RsiW
MNRRDRKLSLVEQWFDGDEACAARAKELIASDAECAAHAESLRTLREAAQGLAHRQEIQSPQFPAFMKGIRDRIEPPRRRYRGVLAAASAVAASLIVAVSLFVMTSSPPEDVSAEVERVDTFIEGAEVGYYETDDGTMTVWVDIPEGDLP